MRINWFVKTLLTYLLLAAILLFSVSVPIINIVGAMVEEESANGAGRDLLAIKTVFEQWKTKMDEYAMQMRSSILFNPYLLATDNYNALRVTEELNSTVVYGNFCDAIALVYDSKYFPGKPLVYNNTNYEESDIYFNVNFRYDLWDRQSIYSDMRTATRSYLRAPEWVSLNRTDRAQYLTYVVPMTESNSVNKRGVLLFMTHIDSFKKMFAASALSEDATLVMADADGNVVMTMGAIRPDENFGCYFREPIDECTISGEDYTFLKTKSSDQMWNFGLLMPKSAISEAIRPRLNSVVLIILFSLLLAAVISFVLSFIVFRPVSRLAHIARVVQDKNATDENELLQIESAMLSLSQNNNDLISRLHSQSANLRQYLFQSMCFGHIEYKESFLALIQESHITFYEDAMRVAELRIDDAAAFESRMESSLRALTRYTLIKLMREAMKDYGISSIGCESSSETRVITLLSGEVADTENLISALEGLQQVFAKHFGHTLTIGVSTFFTSLDEMPVMYRQAAGAADRQFVEGCARIYFADAAISQQLPVEEVRKALDMRVRMRMSNALREKKHAVAADALMQYVQSIRDMELPAELARQYMLILRSELLQQLHLLGLSTFPTDSVRQNYETLDNMKDALLVLIDKLSENQPESDENSHFELVDHCIAYMQEHIADTELTLESLAEANDISVGYLSRCFKAQTKASPWQYFDGMRMQHACKLLKETTLNISDILVLCGYLDKTNFMRKFKKKFGVTPMEYRKMTCPTNDD